MDYKKLVVFVEELVEVVQKQDGFLFKREQGYHILFNESEMSVYFDEIRKGLTGSGNKRAGKLLAEKLRSNEISTDASNIDIWKALITSLNFSGVDFEQKYKILPSNRGETEHTGDWTYSFEESIVLGHTLLVVPVMQHYGPLTPKLDLKSNTKRFEQPQPLLVVGMIGDCVKGKFFEELQERAKQGNLEAASQIDNLTNPHRLQQKMQGLFRALLQARKKSDGLGLLVDATLVGAGAFGGLAKVLAQPFVDSLNDMPFDNTKDEVNFFMFPPPKPEELTIESLKYKACLNPKNGLGSEAADNIMRIVVAGFDPISLAPHGVVNRVVSAEGQISHVTDLLYRLTGNVGKFVRVQVPKGLAWESAAAFFANEHKYKDEMGYETVRFVPESVLAALGLTEGQDAHVQLLAKEPRAWNGDSFNGWTLSLEVKTWQEILSPSYLANFYSETKIENPTKENERSEAQIKSITEENLHLEPNMMRLETNIKKFAEENQCGKKAIQIPADKLGNDMKEVHQRLDRYVTTNHPKEKHQEAKRTLSTIADALASGAGGVFIAVVDADDFDWKDFVFNPLDEGKLFKVLNKVAQNIHESQQSHDAFLNLLNAFSCKGRTNRWEHRTLRILAEDLHKAKIELQALKDKPKDGAFIISCAGDVINAAGHINVFPSTYKLDESTGIRHASSMDLAVWLGDSERLGAVFVRSDDGGVHVLLPQGKNIPPEVMCFDSLRPYTHEEMIIEFEDKMKNSGVRMMQTKPAMIRPGICGERVVTYVDGRITQDTVITDCESWVVRAPTPDNELYVLDKEEFKRNWQSEGEKIHHVKHAEILRERKFKKYNPKPVDKLMYKVTADKDKNLMLAGSFMSKLGAKNLVKEGDYLAMNTINNGTKEICLVPRCVVKSSFSNVTYDDKTRKC